MEASYRVVACEKEGRVRGEMQSDIFFLKKKVYMGEGFYFRVLFVKCLCINLQVTKDFIRKDRNENRFTVGYWCSVRIYNLKNVEGLSYGSFFFF